MGELSSFASQICETLNKTSGYPVAVTDRDMVIAAAGAPRRDLTDKRVGEELEKIMESRQLYSFKSGERKINVSDGLDKYFVEMAAPIVSEGDVSGCVLFVAAENPAGLSDTELKLAQTVAGFLGKQMES